MKNSLKLALALASLTLVGAGCAATPDSNKEQNANAPENGAMMKDENATGTMMKDDNATDTKSENEEDGAMMGGAKVQTGTMIRGGEGEEGATGTMMGGEGAGKAGAPDMMR